MGPEAFVLLQKRFSTELSLSLSPSLSLPLSLSLSLTLTLTLTLITLSPTISVQWQYTLYFLLFIRTLYEGANSQCLTFHQFIFILNIHIILCSMKDDIELEVDED